jgi:hypothetical protein
MSKYIFNQLTSEHKYEPIRDIKPTAAIPNAFCRFLCASYFKEELNKIGHRIP